MFQKIEGAAVLLFKKGVWKVADVWIGRYNQLYAQLTKNSFITLSGGNKTSLTATVWEHIEGVDYRDDGPFGRLVLKPQASLTTPVAPKKGKKRAA